ncbi:MAG: hypothetical protein JNM96_05600 [Bacteroidia bacterium]|nr:hypothetical protein [Bacteroidia bacterium]
MNTTSRIIKLAVALVVTLGIAFTACKKKEIQGPKGDPGDPGIGGNANITSTNTFVVNSSAWVADSVNECLKVTLNFTELTQNVVDNGAVKVFRQDGTVWSELPITTSDLFTQFGFDVGKLYLNYINIEGGIPGAAPATAKYRMVIQSKL